MSLSLFGFVSVVILILPYVMPRIFLILYLILYTRVFSLLPVNYIKIQGVFDLFTLFESSMLISVFIIILVQPGNIKKPVFVFLGVVSFFVCYGITLPVLFGNSNVFLSIISSREMLAYALLGFLVVKKNFFSYEWLSDLIIIFSIILSIVVLSDVIFGDVIQSFSVNLDYRERFTTGARISSPLLLSIGVILLLNRKIQHRYNIIKYLLVLLMLTTLLFVEERAYILILICTLFISEFLNKKKRFPVLSKYLIFLILSVIIVGVDRIEGRIVNPIKEVIYGSGALEARNEINKIRYDYINKRMLWGYGFINISSDLGREIKSLAWSKYNETLSYGDGGYMDLLIKFGLPGTILILWAYIYLIFKSNKRPFSSSINTYLKILLLFLLVLLYVSSVLTYRFGIVPICLIVYLLYYTSGEKNKGYKCKVYHKSKELNMAKV